VTKPKFIELPRARVFARPHARAAANFANFRSHARARRSRVESSRSRHAGGMVDRMLESRPTTRETVDRRRAFIS
jgi:hypothetical protein